MTRMGIGSFSDEGDEYVAAEGVVRGATAKAIRFYFREAQEEKWVPRSLCARGDEIEPGETDVEIEVRRWWMEKEGLT